MRAKDTARLNVLRALLAETTNAAKLPSAKPLTSDTQILAILKKRRAASLAAAEEASAASRPDLREKQEAEIRVLDEYAQQVQVVSGEVVHQAIDGVIQKLRAAGEQVLKEGVVMKELFSPGGGLEGRPVEKHEVIKAVREKLQHAQ